MTTSSISTVPTKEFNVVNISSPYLLTTNQLQTQTSQPEIKTPTFATPIGQQTPMQSLFPFDDQRTTGLSPNFLSLNAFGNLSSSSLLNGLTLASPVASTSNTAAMMNNNPTPLQMPLQMNANQMQLNLGTTGTSHTTNGVTVSNVLSNDQSLMNNTQTPVMNRPLVPDGQSGLLPQVGHTPLIADAMKAYNSIFQPQFIPGTTVGNNLENQNQEISTSTNGKMNKVSGNSNKSVLELGMSPLADSFSDLKIDINQIQTVNQVLPSLTATSSQVVPLEMLSSVPSLPDGLLRGESVVSAVSEGNAHFVPFFPIDEPQVSDGGLGASPTSGATLQFALQMGQSINMNNSGGGNMMNNASLLNGMPTVPGFAPMTTMLNYDTGGQDMSMMDTSGVPKSYQQEYWMNPFTIPMSQYVPTMDFNMNNNGMYPTDTSNLYSMGPYTTVDQTVPSQMSMNDYNNMSVLTGSEMEGGNQQTTTVERRRQKQSGGQRNTTRTSRRGRNVPLTNSNTNGSTERSTPKGGQTQSQGHGETSELAANFERDNVSLMDLVKNELIEKCARDQHGSRYIQRALETASLTEKSAVFKQIEKCALGLCEDVFGNYVIQKFFDHGTDNHKITLAKILIGRVLPLTKSMYGCRVIQKALESVEQNMRIALVSELDGHVEECVRDQNGNHVIQKAIEEVAPENLDFIVKTFHGKVYDFSTHPYGCRVIQRLLERCTLEQKEPLLNEILKQVSTLSKDQYGNYVVQHMLQHGTPKARSTIIEIVANNIVSMSRQKFSSNVVEKLFTHSTEEEKEFLIEHIMGFQNEAPPIVQMVRDQYGNYVIQKILEVATQQQRNRLINRIFELVPNLRKLMFGKHIINKIERITGNQYK